MPNRFTEEDLLQPIFIEPHEGIERPDEWSAPHGFLIGCMGSNFNYVEIASQYMAAADQLVEDIGKQRIADYTIALPVLFLYRHAIELILKGAMRGGWGHKMDALAGQFDTFIQEKYGRTLAPWVLQRLHEIAQIDPNSTSFRYAEKSSNRSGSREPLGGEHYVDVFYLQKGMKALFAALQSALHIDPGATPR